MNTIIKGKNGFLYEFKPLDANGNITFIYYRTGDREFHGMTFHVWTGLCDDTFSKRSTVVATMRGYPTSGAKVEKYLLSLFPISTH